jgi:hypothetical protein
MLATPKGGLLNLAWTGLTGPARAANRSWLEVGTGTVNEVGTGTVNVEAPSDQAAAPGATLTLSVDARPHLGGSWLSRSPSKPRRT